MSHERKLTQSKSLPADQGGQQQKEPGVVLLALLSALALSETRRGKNPLLQVPADLEGHRKEPGVVLIALLSAIALSDTEEHH